MAFISDESVLEVKRAADIQEVVRGYLPGLKRAGANYKALCPFHDERTPSFNVHPEKQIYKCFGCGKAGDAISFVMEIEKCDYPEAISILAGKYGITLQYKDAGGAPGLRKEDLFRLNDWAATVFRKQLHTPAGAHALGYLRKRGVSEETEETFRLGFASDEWEGLLSLAHKAGFSDDVILGAGLAVPREGGRGCYDRFRNRLMFPITDMRGKVIAFGGRALGEEEGAKYINSSESAIFSKGRGFYALDLQRETIEKSKTIYIVEGYFDVILPYQHGVRGLVATLGTALTKDHLKVLRRYVDRVVLVFDGDEAGRRANERGLDLLLSENLDLFVAGLPNDEDPCDVVVNHGAERLRSCLENPQEIFDFLVASMRQKYGEETTAARARVIDEILERLVQIPDPVKVDVLVRRLAELFGVEERSLRSKMRQSVRREPEVEDAHEMGPSPEEAVGRALLGILLNVPALVPRICEAIPLQGFPGGTAKGVAAHFYEQLSLKGGDLLALLQDPGERQLVAELLGEEIEEKLAERRLKSCVEYVRTREFATVANELKASARASRTPEELNHVMSELIKRRQQQPAIPRSLPRS